MDDTWTSSPSSPQSRSDLTAPATAGRTSLELQPIRAVAVYFSRLGAPMYTHEKVTLSIVAESIARVNGWSYAGVYDAAERSGEGLYFVPDDTLMLNEAQDIGIHCLHQLNGAVAPYPFV